MNLNSFNPWHFGYDTETDECGIFFDLSSRKFKSPQGNVLELIEKQRKMRLGCKGFDGCNKQNYSLVLAKY